MVELVESVTIAVVTTASVSCAPGPSDQTHGFMFDGVCCKRISRSALRTSCVVAFVMNERANYKLCHSNGQIDACREDGTGSLRCAPVSCLTDHLALLHLQYE